MRNRLLTCIAAFFLICTGIAAQTYKGDMNNDGKVNVNDFVKLIDVVLDKSPQEEISIKEQIANCKLTFTLPDNTTVTVNGDQLVSYEYITKHEYTDLGLTSGTLWANTNVGADSPEGYGDYFAWGETKGFYSGKDYFDVSTYKYCNGSETTMIKYCTESEYGEVDNKTELDLEDDAAYVNWGSDWQMPSDAQWTELRTECTWEWTTLNEVYGRKVTGPNGNYIFLPATGYCLNNTVSYLGAGGRYWSRTLYPGYSNCACRMRYNKKEVLRRNGHRYYGFSVRPVRIK
jgi:hypothetical protein